MRPSQYLNYFASADGDIRNKIAIGTKKIQALLDKADGQLVTQVPANFAEIPADRYLVLVVDNGAFDAAWCIIDEEDFKLALDRTTFGERDRRKKTLMTVAKAKVIPHEDMWF